MTQPQTLTLAGTLCAMGNLGADDLAAITAETPRISFQLPGDQTVHLLGLTREHIVSMAPLFYQPVQIFVQPAQAEGDEARRVRAQKRLILEAALVESKHSESVYETVLEPAFSIPSGDELREMLFSVLDSLVEDEEAIDLDGKYRFLGKVRELVSMRQAQAALPGLQSEVESLRQQLAAAQAPGAAQKVTDEQIDSIAEAMPNGLEGFLKQWGYRQFAREVLALRQMPTWEPQFDAMGDEQGQLAFDYCQEIAGLKGQPGSPPDPVRLLEMAEALYKAERASAALLEPGSPA